MARTLETPTPLTALGNRQQQFHLHLTVISSHLTIANQQCSHIDLERRNKSLLRDIDLAELAHALLALFLLLEKLALAGDVAAIALGGDVLAEGAHGLARNADYSTQLQ